MTQSKNSGPPLPRAAFYFVFFLGGLISSCQTGEKAVKKAGSHHKLAVSLIAECDSRRALNHLLKAIALQPGDFLARHTLASVYFFLDQHDMAANEFSAILRMKPDFTEARVNLAKIYIEAGRQDKALEELERAGRDLTYASHWKIVSQKGQAYFKKGDFLKAHKLFSEALSIPPAKNCFNSVYLGRTKMAMGHLKEAEAAFIQALPLCQRETPLCQERLYQEHFFLARLYMKTGALKKASYHMNIFLKRAGKGNPHLPEARRLQRSLKRGA